MFVGNALLVVPYALWRDGRDVVPAMRHFWRRGLAGGALQVFAYGTVLWAMTLAPIAIVATLRETSVLFGALIAVAVLKEPLRAVRIAAVVLIVAGLVLIRLQ
jgi:drug/metabolite transporter (DMT)-like permease